MSELDEMIDEFAEPDTKGQARAKTRAGLAKMRACYAEMNGKLFAAGRRRERVKKPISLAKVSKLGSDD